MKHLEDHAHLFFNHNYGIPVKDFNNTVDLKKKT